MQSQKMKKAVQLFEACLAGEAVLLSGRRLSSRCWVYFHHFSKTYFFLNSFDGFFCCIARVEFYWKSLCELKQSLVSNWENQISVLFEHIYGNC